MVEEGLMIIDDDDFIEKAVKSVFDKNPNEFSRLKNGESKLVGFFMGQIMKEVKGKVNPKSIQEVINKYIGN
jgi:aspartyl-tRNA(Asn)/glutamyl-tRNA(Gln) amidotransferase subunit B